MKSKIVGNTVSLYIMNIAKLILPLVTLPYLTRVLSKESYGVVAYVKAVMQYMQLIIDFGFILSGTKDIVKIRDNKKKLNQEVGDILGAKVILAVGAGGVLSIISNIIPILKNNIIYTFLSFVVVFMTCFLFDYLFRGIEQMHVITIRYVIMKFVSTILTFILVKNDNDILWIPVLDIIGSVLAIGLVVLELKKRNICVKISSIRNILSKIKESAIYFASEAATTIFSIFNTLLIGMFISEIEVAEWSLCMQLVAAVQAFYTPLVNGIYPEMVKTKNYSIIKKTVKIFMPIVFIGCIFTFFVSEYVLILVGGKEYGSASKLMRCLIPVLFFSFPSMLYGWPTLGAIGKVKETTTSTVSTAMIQVIGVVLLLIYNQFTVINIALLRGLTEFILFVIRYAYCKKYKNIFVR